MNQTTVAQRLSVAVGAALTGAVILTASLVSGCQPVADHEPFPGATVPVLPDITASPDTASPVSRPLPDCDDTAGFGPCTYVDDAPDGQLHWYYVEAGGMYPDLKTIDFGFWNPAMGTPYVPQCPDVATHAGPCVGHDGDRWTYVPTGSRWPNGRTIDLCPTMQGGPEPCAWVPSVQSGNSGDSGAYVYGVTQ